MFGLGLTLINSRRLTPTTTLPILSLFILGVGLGLPLAWQAVAGLRGKPSRRFVLPSAWGLGASYALPGGTRRRPSRVESEIGSGDDVAAIPHLGAGAPAAALPVGSGGAGEGATVHVAAAVGRTGWRRVRRSGAGFRHRDHLACPRLVAVVIILGASPDWVEQLRQSQLAPGGLADSPLVRSLIRNPLVIFTLLVSFSLVVPLIEETTKSLVPALAGVWQRPSVAQTFLWGVASGAGFAVVEGLLNGGLSTEGWASVALLRIGASAMHCLTAGLTGWGWGQVWTQRKWLRLLVAYLAAITLHGMWNAVSIGMAVRGHHFGPRNTAKRTRRRRSGIVDPADPRRNHHFDGNRETTGRFKPNQAITRLDDSQTTRLPRFVV